MKKGKLFIISATSGAGKSTLGSYILEKFPNVKWSVSATTRKKRDGEIHGKDYFFISKNDFENKIKNNDFLEYSTNYKGSSAKYYGTLKEQIKEVINLGKSIICEIDVKGFSQLQDSYKEDFISIFIKAPTLEIARQRLIARGTNSLQQIDERLSVAKNELSKQNEYDYVIINDDLEIAKKEIVGIFQKNLS
ncbi:MAG: guanylate kinase [Alphaproteobacteria bacterium]